MFTIDHRTENGLNVIYLIDNSSQTSVGILPDHGALLHAFTIMVNDQPFNIIDNYKDIEELKQQLSTSYKSAKLSPFVCRTNKGKYLLNGKEYEFQNKFPDGTAIHGLLFNHKFTEIESFVNEQNACITLGVNYKAEDAGYPYNYSCHVTYTLLPCNELKINTTVVNKGPDPMPLADGWHPYFKLGAPVDELELKFNSTKMLEFNDSLIPTGDMIDRPEFKEGKKMGDTQLDNCFLLEKTDKDQPVCTLSNPSNGLQLKIYAEQNYPFLQLYTPPGRQSIAIENLSGAPDCFNNRMGLLIVAGGEQVNFSVRYSVSANI